MAEKHENPAKQLGEFLRLRREQLSPERAGLIKGPRRRTPGLRREEVAQLSYVSTTWYTWLEQGRGMTVSPRSLSGIATALQLSKAERVYLFSLAGLTDPLNHVTLSSEPSVKAIVQVMTTPCYIMNAAWQVVAWNQEAAALFSGWLTEESSPNMLEFIFMNPLARHVVVDWPERAQQIVAELRAESLHLEQSAPLKATIDGLLQQSGEFAEWWQKHHVIQREGGQRSFHHPQQGLVHYQQTTWQLAPDPSTKLVTLIPLSEV
ncbi:helix-turn-helix domain-containing protein [Rosenbergiella sp. S61]|uniref:Helix-turn-helix domain-containing protein n=1 Tax=Rosenbergiella gaditana TaxID=2726987 RepID=A0ABS5SXY0_9GAMM|nr:helix-turn-helix transcriptional regulator [Rosenbergiella gaditana]MBT0724944.1 helix-turn-helix domain-containing protein [Rosenbergiella gaditana]